MAARQNPLRLGSVGLHTVEISELFQSAKLPNTNCFSAAIPENYVEQTQILFYLEAPCSPNF
jgi:hypothetical protein